MRRSANSPLVRDAHAAQFLIEGLGFGRLNLGELQPTSLGLYVDQPVARGCHLSRGVQVGVDDGAWLIAAVSARRNAPSRQTLTDDARRAGFQSWHSFEDEEVLRLHVGDHRELERGLKFLQELSTSKGTPLRMRTIIGGGTQPPRPLVGWAEILILVSKIWGTQWTVCNVTIRRVVRRRSRTGHLSLFVNAVFVRRWRRTFMDVTVMPHIKEDAARHRAVTTYCVHHLRLAGFDLVGSGNEIIAKRRVGSISEAEHLICSVEDGVGDWWTAEAHKAVGSKRRPRRSK